MTEEIHSYLLKDLTDDQLVLIREIRKHAEMMFALTGPLLGMNSGTSTAKEVEAILEHRRHERAHNRLKREQNT